jgi:hypothetical protein
VEEEEEEDRIRKKRKKIQASYTSSLRPHTLVA